MRWDNYRLPDGQHGDEGEIIVCAEGIRQYCHHRKKCTGISFVLFPEGCCYIWTLAHLAFSFSSYAAGFSWSTAELVKSRGELGLSSQSNRMMQKKTQDPLIHRCRCPRNYCWVHQLLSLTSVWLIFRSIEKMDVNWVFLKCIPHFGLLLLRRFMFWYNGLARRIPAWQKGYVCPVL